MLVDPIVMFFTGGLILCEDCREYVLFVETEDRGSAESAEEEEDAG